MSSAQPKSKEYIEDSDSETGSVSSSVSDSDDIDRVAPVAPPQTPSNKSAEAYPKFQAAKGLYPVTVSATYSSPFEFDSMASKPGVELWAIRVPKELKLSRMSNLIMDLQRGRGTLVTSSNSFKLREAGPSRPKASSVSNEGRDPVSGPGIVDAMLDEDGALFADAGQEMAGLRVLVPSKRSGKLNMAPVPISRTFVLSAVEDAAHHDAPFSSQAQTLERPTKRKQPLHLLAFRNRACGFDTPGPKRSKVGG